MAEEDIAEMDIEDALDWLYVEDDYPLADELAETQIPDPGYAGTRYELEMEEMDDFDVFGYWDDLEYGDDSFWEYELDRSQVGSKRKRGAVDASKPNDKRLKLSLLETEGDNVLFVDRGTRRTMAAERPLTNRKFPSFALLPDWRERFADTNGEPLKKEMPAAMRKAAEAKHGDSLNHDDGDDPDGGDEDDWETDDGNGIEDLTNQLGSADPELVRTIMQTKLNEIGLQDMNAETLLKDLEIMDEDTYLATLEKLTAANKASQGETPPNDDREEPEDEDNIGNLQDMLASLDPEILKTVLKQKLGGTGLSDADEDSLMTMLGKMVNGDEEADDMTDDFMKHMLDRAAQGNDPALSGWLAQQGVPLDAAEDVGEEDNNESAGTAESSARKYASVQSQNMNDSPSDSVVGAQNIVNGTSKALAMHGSSPSSAAKKRPAPSTPAKDPASSKRTKVSFDMPPSSGSTVLSQHDSVVQVEEDKAPGTDTRNDNDEDNIQVVQAKGSRGSHNQDDNDDDDNIRIVQPQNSDSSTAKTDGFQISKDDSQARADVDEAADAEEVVVAPAPAKNTRKRKAEAEKLAPNKKQDKKISGPAANAGKRTRTTRAAAKAGK